MPLQLHTIERHTGPTALSKQDRVQMWEGSFSFPGGDGDPTAVAIATAGVGYKSAPTMALATVGTGSGSTLAAHLSVQAAPTITAGGTGGAPGAVTLTGTTGTGTKFQVAGTINGGGVLTAIGAISVAGDYTVLPTVIGTEPVTGGGLTGATLNLGESFGLLSVAVGGASNHLYPSTGVTATVTGGTPTTAGTMGAVTITAVAGQPATIVVQSGSGNIAAANFLGSLPTAYRLIPGACTVAGCTVSAVKNTPASTGFTLTVTPRTADTLVAGSVDFLVLA